MNRLSLYAIFCDDVRREVGNKRTYVGVYTDVLYVPSLPTLIPKFFIVTSITCLRENIPKKLAVRFVLADQELETKPIDEKALEEWRTKADQAVEEEGANYPADQPLKTRLMVEALVSPFVVDREGRLTAFVETETASVRAGTLKIVKKEGEHSPAIGLRRPEPK